MDTRDLIAEIEGFGISDWENIDPEELAELDASERKRVRAILELAEEIGSEFRYGAQLIEDGEFVEYAQQLAEDIGALPADAGWPAQCIDWERAADELRVDYTSVSFDGVDYLVRA